jgi:hypothetical protein
MRREQTRSNHIPEQKLREIAAESLEEPGFVALRTILTAEEAGHFQECGTCTDALAKIARELGEKRIHDKKRKASPHLQ